MASTGDTDDVDFGVSPLQSAGIRPTVYMQWLIREQMRQWMTDYFVANNPGVPVPTVKFGNELEEVTNEQP